MKHMIECTVAICRGDKLIGSGVIVGQGGLVVTCNHVIVNSPKDEICVKVGSQKMKAELYEQDQIKDIAILKPGNRANLKYAPIGKNGNLNLGEDIFVTGFSVKDDLSGGGVTCAGLRKGIISRIIYDEVGDNLNYIETNINVDEGYSGGPTFDTNGNLIGIVTTKKSEGIACCIPIGLLSKLVPQSDLEPVTDLLTQYVKNLVHRYRKPDWTSIFNYYIDLRCSTKKGDKYKLMDFVRNKWLPCSSKSNLAILGEFGSGKTLFCNKLTNQMAEDYEAGGKIPILIKLGNIKIDVNDSESFEISLLEEIRKKTGLSSLTWEKFQEILHSGQVILIYDGFEEMTIEESPFSMGENFNKILSTIVPGVKLIITCRTHFLRSEKEEQIFTKIRMCDEIESLLKQVSAPNSLSIVYLEPFDDNDIDAYLHAYLQSKNQENLYQKLKDEDERFYNLADLAKRPIFLAIIAETMEKHEFLGKTDTGTELYQHYVEICFKRELNQKNIVLSVELQSQIVEEIAYRVYKERLNYLSRELIENIWQEIKPKKPRIKAEDFMRKYSFFRPVESDKSGEYLEFIHQSFLEFFVARRIFRSLIIHDHELYAAEYLSSPIDRYLYELLYRSGNIGIIQDWLERHPDVNLRMNCAITLGRSGKGEFIPFLQKCLKKERQKVEKKKIPGYIGDIGVAGRIAEALYSLGDTGSLSEFLMNLDDFADRWEPPPKADDHRLLYDIVGPLRGVEQYVINQLLKDLTHSNPRIRKYTVFTLSRTRTQACVPGLINCMKNPDEPIRTRRYAIAGLGIIGSVEALPELENVFQQCNNELIRQECLKAIEKIKSTSAPISNFALKSEVEKLNK